MGFEKEDSRKRFEERLAAEGMDIMDYAREEKDRREEAKREEAKDEVPIIATSKTVETQIIKTLQAREKLGEDALTGAKNLRKYQEETERLQMEAKIARENKLPRRKTDILSEEPFALIAFDIDNFKQINDTYGHAAGDEVLREVVQRIQGSLRKGDILARCGGEEFRIIALTTNGSATRLAERIRRLIAENPFVIHDNEGNEHRINVTASFGVCTYDKDTHNMELRSDAALYLAKGNERLPEDQRNQVWAWNPSLNKAVRYVAEKRTQPPRSAPRVRW